MWAWADILEALNVTKWFHVTVQSIISSLKELFTLCFLDEINPNEKWEQKGHKKNGLSSLRK